MSPLQHILYIYLNLFQNWRFWTTHITQLFLFEIHCSWVGMHFEGNARIALWCSLLYSCFCLCLCRSTVAVLLDSHAHSKSPSITKALIPQLWTMIHGQSSTQHLPYSLFEIHSFRATSVWCILWKKHEDLMYPCGVFAWGQYGFDLVFMKNLGFFVCLWDVQMLVRFGIDFTWFLDLQDVDLFCGECVSECWDVSWGTGNSSPATTRIWRPSIPLSPFWSGSAVVCSLVFGHVMVSTLVHYL